TFVLAGPPSSGRSNALAMITSSALAAEPTTRAFYLGNAKSRLGGFAGFEKVARTVDDVVELAREITALAAQPSSPGHSIRAVVEGLSDFLSTPADMALIEMTKALKRGDHFVVAESETSTWQSSWPLLAEVKSG